MNQNSYQSTPARVLITGARAPVALELARSFAAAGHTVHMADSMSYTLARWSNTIQSYTTLPPPAQAPQAFLEAVQTLIDKEKIQHLIPTCEEAFYLSYFKDQLQCNVWTSEFDLMHRLHHKLRFIDLAASFFQVPKTRLATEFDDWTNSKDFVFKKIYSRFATSALIGPGDAACQQVKENPSEWIVQEKLTGKEVCVYSVWENGDMKAFACYHPLYRVGQGAGIFFTPANPPGLMEKVKAFGEHYLIHGQLSFDVILQNDQPLVIECNPRSTSGAHLLHQQLWKAFLEPGCILPSSDQDFCVRYAMVFGYPMHIFDKKVYKAKDVIFSKKDIQPFLFQALSLAEIAWRKHTFKCSWLEATTADIEWNGNENILGH